MGDEVDLAAGLLALHPPQLRGEEGGRLDDRAVGVVLGVAAAVVGVGEVPDLALGLVVAERVDVQVDGGPLVPCRPGAVDAGDDHHAVRGATGAVGSGRVAAVGVDRVHEASADGDEVERDLPGRRARQRARGDAGASDRIAATRRGPPRSDRRAASLARSVVASRKSTPASTDSPAWSPSQLPTSHTASTASPMNGRSVSQSSASVYAAPPAPGAWPGAGSRSEAWRSRCSTRRRPCGLVWLVGRDEVHQLGEVVRTEELHRIDVAVTDAQPEVEHGPFVVAVGRVGGAAGRAEHLARATAWPARTDTSARNE